MRRMIIVLATAVSVLLLTACAQKTVTTAPDTTPAAEQPVSGAQNEQWERYTNLEEGYSFLFPSTATTPGKEYFLSNIKIYPAPDEAAVLAAVKKELGAACELGERLTMTTMWGEDAAKQLQPGIVSIAVDRNSMTEPGEDRSKVCFINGVYKILYSSEFKKAAIILLGQDYNFAFVNGYSPDNDVIASFSFTE